MMNIYQMQKGRLGSFGNQWQKVSLYLLPRTNTQSFRKKYRSILFFLLGNLLVSSAFSQTLVEEVYERHRFIQPKNGVLRSSFGPVVDVSAINGQIDADTVGFETAQDAMRVALLQQAGIAAYDSVWQQYTERQQQHIGNAVLPISVIDMQYQEVNPEIERQKRWSVSDDSSYRLHLSGFVDEVYLTKYVLTAVTPVAKVRSDVRFAILDSHLVISNFTNWRSMKWFWEGEGRKIAIAWNVPFELPRSAGGGPIIGTLSAEVAATDKRVDLMESPYRLGSGKYRISAFLRLEYNFPNGSAPDLLAQNDLSIHYYVNGSNPSLKAMYTVHLGYGEFGKVRRCMERPILIVEGVDYGYPGYPKGFRDQKYGENGYIDLLKGQNWDVPSQIWKNWESIEAAPATIERLRKAGYDIVYVDFWDGAQDMNHNAEVLIEVIKKVQQQMCGREMHVLGVSMGGVLAKRALRLMENRGISHCVMSLTSFDSPHQGANLSLGLQHTIEYFKGSLGVCDDLFHRVIRRRSTQQLLVNHEKADRRESGARTEWLREDTLYGGYPDKPWLLAISNGASGGKSDNMQYSNVEKLQPGMTMMRLQLDMMVLFGWINNYVVDIYAENFYDRKTKDYYNGRVNMFKKFYSNKDNVLWDHVPGSTMKQFQVFEELGKHFLLKTGYLSMESCFVPTVSSLDLVSGGYDVNSIVEKDFSVNEGNMTNVLSNDMRTPFHRVYIPKENQPHVKLDTSKGGNIDWLIAELTKISRTEDPHTVADDYNLRSPHIRNLKGLTINKSGMFELNGVGSYPLISKEDSTLANSAEERVFYAGDCAGANFEVRDSAKFLLGKHLQATKLIIGGKSTFNVQHAGELRVVKGHNTLVLAAGTKMVLQDEAILRIEDGSKLVIEEGASLQMSGRSKIYLEGSSALFHVKGQLILDSGARFQPIPGRDGVVGLVKFTNVGHGYGEAEIVAEGGARMIFEGNGKNGTRTLQLEGLVHFPESGSGKDLSRMEITRSVVCFGPLSKAYLKGRVSVTDSKMEPVEWSEDYCGGYHFIGSEGTFENLEFYRQDTGIYYDQGGLAGIQAYKGNEFTRCRVGMHVETSYVHVYNSTFEANEIGISMNNIWKESVIESSKFYQNNIGAEVVNSTEAYGQLLTLNNEFYENNIGYRLNRVGLFLNCHRFGGNGKGLVAEESSLRLDDAVILESARLKRKFRAGVNVFTNQKDAAIELDNSELWANGQNYFHHTKSTYSGTPFIQGDYRLVKFASYYEYGTGKVHLGRNRFYPTGSGFKADSLNEAMVQLKYRGFPLGVNAYLMTAFEGATCAIDRDPSDKLQQKYNVNELALDKEFLEDKANKGALIANTENGIRLLVGDVGVQVYATDGALIATEELVSLNQSIELPSGIYFVHISGNGWSQTEKVIVHP